MDNKQFFGAISWLIYCEGRSAQIAASQTFAYFRNTLEIQMAYLKMLQDLD